MAFVWDVVSPTTALPTFNLSPLRAVRLNAIPRAGSYASARATRAFCAVTVFGMSTHAQLRKARYNIRVAFPLPASRVSYTSNAVYTRLFTVSSRNTRPPGVGGTSPFWRGRLGAGQTLATMPHLPATSAPSWYYPRGRTRRAVAAGRGWRDSTCYAAADIYPSATKNLSTTGAAADACARRGAHITRRRRRLVAWSASSPPPTTMAAGPCWHPWDGLQFRHLFCFSCCRLYVRQPLCVPPSCRNL